MASDVLDLFTPATHAWFTDSFDAPTPAQEGAWRSVAAGRNALVVAPTGSGKTLAAFLWSLDQLAASTEEVDPAQRCRVLYVSPLKALTVDVERNLRAPLAGIARAGSVSGGDSPAGNVADITVGIRTGDTPADARRRMARTPPDILITTPESLFLVLTSQARESLRGVTTVIVDEVHAVAGTKRGAHLALSLERLDALLPAPAQRIGLSATVRPIDEVARFLGGSHPVEVVAPESEKAWDLQVVVPVPDLSELGADATPDVSSGGADDTGSIWPHVEERVADLVSEHRSTIVFANSRRLAERLTARVNEVARSRAEEESSAVARAHHGSVSREQRAIIEDDLKSGRLPAVVATSSLELGIDMGAVDLVIQVESPPSVASGLQRVGRAGHHVGAISQGVLFPKYRGDLVQTAVVAERMRHGLIEELAVPRNALDVLAQQIIAAVALEDWAVDELFALIRRAHSYRELPESSFEAVLDMLAGRYPSDEFAELRPRVIWDRNEGVLRGRPGVQRLAVTSGGTIPDRGLFGVYLAGSDPRRGGGRVGELDEEMVYESRVGDVFALGATSWRIEDITHDRVLVSPAPGQPGRLPFWHGDSLGRPAELGQAMGEFVREIVDAPQDEARTRAAAAGLDGWATDNIVAYLAEQKQATVHVPDHRTLVVERFRDELGDWRLVIHSPYGARVHAPWALAIAARLRERYGVDVQAAHADDGIVIRIPDTLDDPGFDGNYGNPDVNPDAMADAGATASSAGGQVDTSMLVFDPDEIEELVTAEVGTSALFASRFRESAARALLLPRRTPGRRSPLWQQRQRSAQLLEVAARYGSFPILLETMRECLQDVYDIAGLVGLMRDIAARSISLVEVETIQPSPFARSLLFGYIAEFMYEGDAPLAERRAHALTLDSALLSELLGRTELRDLLDAEVIVRTEEELQRTAPDRRARSAEAVADLIRELGPISTVEVAARCTDDVDAESALAELADQRRIIEVRVAGDRRWAAVEDAARLRDALGVPITSGVHQAFTEPVADPLGDLVARYARTHGPFVPDDIAARLGLGVAVVHGVLRRLAASGRVVEGEFRPGASGSDWCDADVLRRIRRRSLAALRQEAEPVDPAALGRFLPAWQSVGSTLRGPDGVLRVVEQLAGYAVPATTWESLVLPARVTGYQTAWLDELTTAGEVLWAGHGALPGNDGWVSLHVGDTAHLTVPDPLDVPTSALHAALTSALDGGGAYFFRALADGVRAGQEELATTTDAEVVAALWDLAWAGVVTNDTLAPLRATISGRPGRSSAGAGRSRSRYARARAAGGRAAPPTVAGRWSLVPNASTETTRRAHTAAEALLARHGVITRGAVVSERVPGGFAAAYRVLAAFEESGRARRGYFVAGLGAAQFATPGAVDRLRAVAEPTSGTFSRGRASTESGPRTLVLAATDPANPYGAALPWPDRNGVAASHRPGRKAGALVVLVDGSLALYVERGGRTLLSWTDDAETLRAVADALALAVREGALGALRIERADGDDVTTTPLGHALSEAGFHVTPRGLRLRR